MPHDRVLLRLRGKKLERLRPFGARGQERTLARERVSVCSESFERVRMDERRTHGADERVRREFGTAVCAGRSRHTDGEAGSGPTRYGPSMLSAGRPVMAQACRMPKKMIAPLIRPEGSDPKTIITGSAAMSPSR